MCVRAISNLQRSNIFGNANRKSAHSITPMQVLIMRALEHMLQSMSPMASNSNDDGDDALIQVCRLVTASILKKIDRSS